MYHAKASFWEIYFAWIQMILIEGQEGGLAYD